MTGRHRPGQPRRGGRLAAACRGLRLLLDEVVPVLAAADAGADDHRGRLGQRGRVAAQCVGQVDRAVALVRVGGQPARQVVQRLPDAERGHRTDQHPVLTGHRPGVRGGDQHPPGRPGRPQPVQVRRVPQVIEHHQPRPGGPVQPGDEPGRHRLGITLVIQAQLRGGLGVAGQDRGPAGGSHPGQQVDRAGLPQRLGQADRELGLAGRPRPARRARGRPGRGPALPRPRAPPRPPGRASSPAGR